MNTLQVLIVDDEPLARSLVREYLRSHADLVIAGECEHGLQAVKDIETLNPDLIFLDIQMPRLTGLEVLEATGRRSGVIFTTAYDQYALKAFDLHAVDYLLKPFSQTRFDQALAQARKTLGQSLAALQNLLVDAGQRPERILIRDRHQVHVVAVHSIEWVEAQDDYISIHSAGKTYMKTQTLAELAAQLDPTRFVRVHRSHLVNLRFLTRVQRMGADSFVAILLAGQHIPLSRAGHARLKAALDGVANPKAP